METLIISIALDIYETLENTGHGIPTIINKYGHGVFELESNNIQFTISLDVEVITKTEMQNVGLNKTKKESDKLFIR